jgi:hypothetical protein
MNRLEIREMLKKRGAGKIDDYLKVVSLKKENESDLLNLAQTWLHCLLYYKRIYPSDAFQERQILGIPVFVAACPPLKEYLDDFFNRVKPHLPHLNHLKVIIYASANREEEIHTLHVQDLTEEGGPFYENQA